MDGELKSLSKAEVENKKQVWRAPVLEVLPLTETLNSGNLFVDSVGTRS